MSTEKIAFLNDYVNRHEQSSVRIKVVAGAALNYIDILLQRWLPDGRFYGDYYEALNPTRDDRELGSFKVNIGTGRWNDWATGDYGDLVGLYAYIHGITQYEAAQSVQQEIEGLGGTVEATTAQSAVDRARAKAKADKDRNWEL
jgi:putative DNA primase/helicase